MAEVEAPEEAAWRRGIRSSAGRALLDAARKLFARDGYESTSVQDITGAAGTSIGTLYYYFGGKAELFYAMYHDYMERQETRVRDAIKIARQVGVTDGRRLFLVGTRAYLNGAWEDRDIATILTDGEKPGRFSAISGDAATRWNERNATLLGLDSAEAGDRAMISAIAGAVGNWTRDLAAYPTRDSAEEYVDQAVTLVAHLLAIEETQ